MDLLQLQQAEPNKDVFDVLAKRVKSSRAYISQLAHGHRKASPDMCKKLVKADARLTLERLRPDIYGRAVAA